LYAAKASSWSAPSIMNETPVSYSFEKRSRCACLQPDPVFADHTVLPAQVGVLAANEFNPSSDKPALSTSVTVSFGASMQDGAVPAHLEPADVVMRPPVAPPDTIPAVTADTSAVCCACIAAIAALNSCASVVMIPVVPSFTVPRNAVPGPELIVPDVVTPPLLVLAEMEVEVPVADPQA
jgi:hypothetical protein